MEHQVEINVPEGMLLPEGMQALELLFPRNPVVRREAAEPVSRLQPLPAGPWRSLGGFLDYASWPDRDRFLQLDAAIQRLPWTNR